MADSKVTRQLSIYINDREVVNSLGGIGREMAKVRGQLKNLNKGTDDYDAKAKELKDSLGKLKDKQAEFKEELADTSVTAGQAQEIFSKLFIGLSTGNLQLVKEGLNGVKGSILGIVKAGVAFIATPIGAAVAVLTGLFLGAKEIFNYNKGLEDANLKLKALGVTASELSATRSEIEATAETFDKSFNEIAEKANSLAKAYGISVSEANTIIAEGLANGGAQNDEFLDSLGEYDELFSKAGFSAEQFVNIINTGFELGIYTDKLPDALKEADLSLREQTTSTRDALVNAFGASFTDQILSQVSSGEITTSQALERIAAQSEKTGLSQQQQAQLTADVFRGAGEDAGGALKVLEAVSKAAQRELSATAKAQLELVDANERVNKAQAELFEIEGFGDVWVIIQAAATSFFADVLEYIAELKRDFAPLIELIGPALGKAFEFGRKAFLFQYKVIAEIIKFLPALIETSVNNILALYNGVLSFVQGFVNVNRGVLELLGVDVQKLQGQIENLKQTKIDVTVDKTENNQVNDNENTTKNVVSKSQEQLDREKKEADARQKARDKAAKLELDKAKALVVAKASLAKAELDNFIANNRTKLEKDTALNKNLIANETTRLASVLSKQIEFNETERLNKIASAKESAKSDKEFGLLREAINLEYETKKQNLELQFQSDTNTLKLDFEVSENDKKALAEVAKKQLEFEQLQIQNELDITTADSKAEEDEIKQKQNYRKELDRFTRALQDKKITQEQFDKFKEAAEEEQAAMNRTRDLQQLKGTLGGLNTVAGAVGQLFGQSKELALVQAGINGAMAVTSILAQYPKFDGGFAMVAAIAAAGITTASQVKEITKAKPPETPKFFFGGATGDNAALGSDQFGKITGVVHDNEYVIPKVMTQDPVYADTISWLESNRQQKMRGFFNGGNTSAPLPTTAPETTTPLDTNLLRTTIDSLVTVLNGGIYAKTIIGYNEAEEIDNLNTEREASANNGILE